MKVSITNQNKLNHYTLLDMFIYNPETGVFIRRKTSGNKVMGSRAGTLHSTGYRYIEILGSSYSEHRLAWFYIHGYWPTNNIDHIDGSKSNNKLNNLREATQSDNGKNRILSKNNSTGHTGVSFYTPLNKYVAKITIDKKQKHIGYYTTIEEAVSARKDAELLHFGEYRNADLD